MRCVTHTRERVISYSTHDIIHDLFVRVCDNTVCDRRHGSFTRAVVSHPRTNKSCMMYIWHVTYGYVMSHHPYVTWSKEQTREVRDMTHLYETFLIYMRHDSSTWHVGDMTHPYVTLSSVHIWGSHVTYMSSICDSLVRSLLHVDESCDIYVTWLIHTWQICDKTHPYVTLSSVLPIHVTYG